MPTDSVMARLWSRKILPIDQFRDGFQEYLRLLAVESVASNFRLPGAFDEAVEVSPDTGHGGNRIQIAPSNPIYATDGMGNIIVTAAADTRLAQIKIPPDAGATKVYHVALQVERVEQGVETDPRSGRYHYREIREEIGYIVGLVDADVDDDGDSTMTFNVNALFDDDTELHVGRTVRIWLKPKEDTSGLLGPGPQTDVEAVAFEECAVVADSTDNVVHTVGTFGQGATPSTVADHYIVALIGPRVHKSTASPDLMSTDGVVFLAEVTACASTDEQEAADIDITEQDPIMYLFGSLGDVFRVDVGSNKLKLSINAQGDDDDTSQIQVKDTGGAVVFDVDVDGTACEVTIDGDLIVTGTETIYASEYVGGDCEVGQSTANTMEVWSKFYLMPGPKGGAYTSLPSLYFGDGTSSTGGWGSFQAGITWDALDASGTDMNIKIEAAASLVNDLWIGRNDTRAVASWVTIENKGTGGGEIGLQVEGQIEIGYSNTTATSPYLKFIATETWYMRVAATSNFEVTVDDASDRTFAFTNSGAGELNVDIEGELQVNGMVEIATTPWRVRATGGALVFDDANTTGDVALSSASDVALTTNKQNLIGAINEVYGQFASVREAGVESLVGLQLSLSTGSVAWTAGVANAGGKRYTIGASSVTGLGAGTWYFYVPSSGGSEGTVQYSITVADAFQLDRLPLGQAIFAGGVATSVTPYPINAARRSQNSSVTVGYDGTTLTNCDFRTVAEALAWYAAWNDRFDDTYRPEVEIVIVGDALVTTTIAIPSTLSGITFRGARRADPANAMPSTNSTGGSRLRFSNNGGFTIDDVTNLTFRDLTITYTHSSDVKRSIIAATSGSLARLTFSNVLVSDLSTGYTYGSFLSVSGTATLSDMMMTGCYFRRQLASAATPGAEGIVHLACTSSRVTIVDNTFHDKESTYDYRLLTIGDTDDTVNGLVLERNRFIGGGDYGAVKIIEPINSRINDNVFTEFEAPNASYYVLEIAKATAGAGATRCEIAHNTFDTSGDTSDPLLYVAGSVDSRICDNTLDGGGIEVADGSGSSVCDNDICASGTIRVVQSDSIRGTRVNGNVLHNCTGTTRHAIYVECDSSHVCDNQVHKPTYTYYAIYVDAVSCHVNGNTVDGDNSHDGINGICVNGTDVQVNGNLILGCDDCLIVEGPITGSVCNNRIRTEHAASSGGRQIRVNCNATSYGIAINGNTVYTTQNGTPNAIDLLNVGTAYSICNNNLYGNNRGVVITGGTRGVTANNVAYGSSTVSISITVNNSMVQLNGAKSGVTVTGTGNTVTGGGNITFP